MEQYDHEAFETYMSELHIELGDGNYIKDSAEDSDDAEA